MTYVYKPYPKWIDTPDGERRIVKDAAEHAIWTTPVQPLPEPADIVTLAPDRDAMIAEAERRGIRIDRRWGDARLKEALDAAEED